MIIALYRVSYSEKENICTCVNQPEVSSINLHCRYYYLKINYKSKFMCNNIV